MVNDRFLSAGSYGFERVDAPRRLPPIDVSPEPQQADVLRAPDPAIFSRMLVKLSSMQSLGIYRGLLKGRADCEPTSQQDNQRTGRRTTGVATMFFLLRMAFWLGLVLVLLPRAKTPEAEKLPQISVSDAVSAASAAVSDMSQFCKRQPQACEVGGQAATVIGARAQEGARKIYQTITDKADSKADKKPEADKKSPDHTGSIGGLDEADVPAEAAARDTLTPDDLAVEWRGLP
jgi:hypothetical protein